MKFSPTEDQLIESIKNLGRKEILDAQILLLKDGDEFPRNITRKFLIEWLTNMKEKIK